MKLNVILLASATVGFFGLSAGADDIDFNRDIRPILSDRCYFCHGPDTNSQEAGLRLDSREEAEAVIESGDLVMRITSDDPDMLMPPPDSNLSLSDEERELLKRWIEDGAEYQSHWSFIPLPETVAIPEVDHAEWFRNTLDRFVLAKIEAAGMVPSREADSLRWFRRASLDLTGLPPTPQQITSFSKEVNKVKNATSDSKALQRVYESAVEQMLSSVAFGEHMAVAWLDSARYADSYGYQSDKLNTQWPYRDWVIKAFNDNLPYDQFLTWQLAGDLLDEPSREQILATAFNRIHRLNNEGGAVFEEWRIENVADRVHTFGTAMLGLTLECCRCHDHKYDPIPQREYYALSAFFNSIDESGVYDRTEKVPCPSILLPTEEQSAQLKDAKQKLAKAEADYQRSMDEAKQKYRDWQASETSDLLIPDLRLALEFDRNFEDSIKSIYHPSESDRSWTQMPELVDVEHTTIARIEPQLAADHDEGEHSRKAIKLDGERGITTKGIEPFDRWMPFSVVVTLRETKRSPLRGLIAHHTRGTDCGYNGWDLTIQDGHFESRMYRVWPGNAIGVRSLEPIPADAWCQVTATYDGSSRASGLRLYLNGEELETTILRDELKKSCNVKVDHGGEFVIGQRFRARGFTDGLIDDLRLYTRALTKTELESLVSGDGVKPTPEYFVSAVNEAARRSLEVLTAARKEVVMAEEAMNEIPIMRETQQSRPAHVLARGEYDAPKNEVTRVDRGTPDGIGLPFPSNAPVDRKGLAQWVTDPRHPLTARVAVNRFWGNFFSEPLVRTPENFGLQGELPTHPDLLDWLARDFVDNDWDVKRFCKNVVLSATYRQDSLATKEQLQRDPTNRLLARGPAHRLAAEQIRDLALAASGLLNPEVGGPPVSPYQPGEDLWKESNSMSPPFKQSVGESLYRRSLYSVWKRTSPLPNMLAFDSTSREVCTVKRSRTNTPLQALVLLNDTQFVEAARVMAQKLISINDENEAINEAFLRLAGRRPDSDELEVLKQLLLEERQYFAAHPDAATQFLAIGDEELTGNQQSASLAALTTVCQTILNLDATIWKR